MTRARDIADVISGNFSLPTGAIAAGSITTAKIAADAITTNKIAAGAVTANEIASGAVPDSTASGTIVPWGGASPPTGWLECDGSAVSRTTYADLFTAIGTTYGAGDGSSTFNLPDMRGRTAVGKDNMGGSAANRITSAVTVDGTTLGQTGGSQSHTLTQAEMPSHRHGADYKTGDVNDYVGGSSNSYGLKSTSNNLYVTWTATGSSNAHTNIQPLIVLNYIIKT